MTRQVARVDPRAPRFGQAITATLALGGVALGEPLLIALLAVLLGVAVLSGWRIDPYGALWKRAVVPLVGPPETRESATPHRFARLVGAIGTALASALFLAGLLVPGAALLGYGVAAIIGALAALGALTGFCLGCRLYGQVSYFQRLGML